MPPGCFGVLLLACNLQEVALYWLGILGARFNGYLNRAWGSQAGRGRQVHRLHNHSGKGLEVQDSGAAEDG